jgi:hypothetical protein
MHLLNSVDLARKRPGVTRRFPAQYLSGHSKVIGWVPFAPWFRAGRQICRPYRRQRGRRQAAAVRSGLPAAR